MKKVLFFDIDGTLVDHEKGVHQIPDSVKKEMKRLQDKGYYLFVASGRPKAFISDTILQGNFDGYILCNGAHVELNGKMIQEQVMDLDDLNDLKSILEALGCEYILETANYAYLKEEYKALEDFYGRCDVNFDMIERHFDVDYHLPKTLKVEVNIKGNQPEDIEKHIQGRFSYDNHGTENAFEIYAKSVSKATGIQTVIDYLDLDLDHCYAFGDGLNDIEMMQCVGHSVAMANGMDELKAICKEQCQAVDQDGLAKYLQTIN